VKTLSDKILSHLSAYLSV